MPRHVTRTAIVAAVIAILWWAMLPRGSSRTAPQPASTVRGAFHVHSNRSDGSGSVDAIAAAAARAGLQFVILTDHGDGTRTPEGPAYHGGVLTIDGVELNTTGGHYVAVGLPASPYPIAGSPEDVIEDVHRLGGFGIAAHPGSPRSSLSWQEWSAPIDGLEWINADSEWRDEPRAPIARALLTYLLRAPESMATLLDRPDAVMRQWDELAVHRSIVGLAGADAHARLGFRQRTDPDVATFHVRLPGYESSFRTFSNHVLLDSPLTGDAAADALAVITSIRHGRVYSVVDALATPGSLSFTATNGNGSAAVGGALAIGGDVVLRASANAPPGTTLVLLRNGQRIHEVTDKVLETTSEGSGTFRIEAYTVGGPGTPAVPWIVSNPIYVGLAPPTRDALETLQSRIPARISEAAGEYGSGDTSAVTVAAQTDSGSRTFTGDPALLWSFALSPGTAAGQFAAAAIPVGGLAGFDRVRFSVSASAPMRVWVQLRAPVGATERWGATFYADLETRTVDIPFTRFRAIGVTSSAAPPLDRVDSLLFVVDTLNTLPGSKGQLTIGEAGFVK